MLVAFHRTVEEISTPNFFEKGCRVAFVSCTQSGQSAAVQGQSCLLAALTVADIAAAGIRLQQTR